MRKKIGNGFLTVEAAVLFGIILSVLTAVLYLGFYLHDRAVLGETAAYYAGVMMHMIEEPVSYGGRLEIRRLEEQDIFRVAGYGEQQDPREIEALFRKEMGDRLLMTGVEEIHAEFGQREVVFTYRARFRWRVGALVKAMLGLEETFSGEVHLKRNMDPEEFIRLCRGVIWRKKE